jgi:4-hydroxyphenylpyruvate dioxygenase
MKKRNVVLVLYGTCNEKDGECVCVQNLHYGETVHIFCRTKTTMVFLPGYKEWKSDYNPEPTGLKYIDHMVKNVG